MQTPTSPNQSLAGQTSFFIEQLSIFYCVKSHLAERLPEIFEEPGVKKIKQALEDAVQLMEKELQKTRHIFTLVNKVASFDNCDKLIVYLDNEFTMAHYQFAGNKPGTIALVAYLYYVEAIEQASLHLMKIAANEMGNPQIIEWLAQGLIETGFESTLLLNLINNYPPLFG